MTLLDRSIWHCCGYKSSTTIGDAFKRFIPAAWSAVYLLACLDYLMVPLLGGNLPRWWGAALVAATGTSVIGLSSSIYGFPRGTSSLAAEEGRDGDSDATIGGKRADGRDPHSLTIQVTQTSKEVLFYTIHSGINLSTIMTFLDGSIWHCCGYKSSTTIGDAFERFVLAAWSAIYLMACLDYLMVPLLGGNLPRWWGAALVAATGTSVIGLSISIYGFPQRASSLTAEEGCDDDGDATIGGTKPRRRRPAVASASSPLSKDTGAADPRDSARADAIPRPPSSIPSESIETDPSATALPRRPSLESADGAALASDSSQKPLQQIRSVGHEEMRLGVRSGQVRPPMTLPKSGEFRPGDKGADATPCRQNSTYLHRM